MCSYGFKSVFSLPFCFCFFMFLFLVGSVTAVSVAGAIGIGAGIWYLRKLKAKTPVTHGVESNENRLF